MKAPTPTPDLNLILGHLMASLPDSLAQRKELLAAALNLMPKDHPLRLPVDEMFRWLVCHEQHQLNLSLDFSASAKSAPSAVKSPKP